jgi:hypothetical protein
VQDRHTQAGLVWDLPWPCREMKYDNAAVIRIGVHDEVIHHRGYPSVGDVPFLGFDDRVNVRLDVEPPPCTIECQVPEHFLGLGECLLQYRWVLARPKRPQQPVVTSSSGRRLQL